LETTYDQRLAAIGPGSILMWWSQERVFAESPPRLGDLIPGHNPQKDRLGPDRTPMVLLEAVRPTPVSGITFPVRRQLRYLAPAVTARVRRRLRGLRAAPPRRRRPGRVPTVEIAPGPAGPPVAPLEPDASARRFLAAVTGHHRPGAHGGRAGAGGRPPRPGPGRAGPRVRAVRQRQRRLGRPRGRRRGVGRLGGRARRSG